MMQASVDEALRRDAPLAHLPFLQAGVPSVDISDLEYESSR
jgi:hypothetical protein